MNKAFTKNKLSEAAEKLNDLCIMCNFTDTYGDYIGAELYYEAVEIAIKTLEVIHELEKRNLTIGDLENYIQFEDECVKKGFTFNSLLEAREKQIPKEVKLEQWMDTKCDCGHVFSVHHGDGYHSIPYENQTNYCPNCGQKLDWNEEE